MCWCCNENPCVCEPKDSAKSAPLVGHGVAEGVGSDVSREDTSASYVVGKAEGETTTAGTNLPTDPKSSHPTGGKWDAYMREHGREEYGIEPEDEFVIGAFCPSFIECSQAGKCLQDCHNKPQPSIVPTPFPARDEAGARVAGAWPSALSAMEPLETQVLKAEPVAQSGAGGVEHPEFPHKLPCGCEWQRTKADPIGPIFWNPFNGVTQCHKCGQVYKPEPAARQVGAEQWLNENGNCPEHRCKLDCNPNCHHKWDTESVEAYAAHVTKGLQEELQRVYELVNHWYEAEKAAEARNLELEKEYKFWHEKAGQEHVRAEELMGELERAQAQVELDTQAFSVMQETIDSLRAVVDQSAKSRGAGSPDAICRSPY